jgi:hypothetical protein
MNNVVGQAVDEFASATKGMNKHSSDGGRSYTTNSTSASKNMSLGGGMELRTQSTNILNIL